LKTVCHNQLSFANFDSRSVVADFSAGPMTSDGGSLLLREIDLATGLSSSMSQALSDNRDQTKVHHGQERLLRQRLFAIAMGYEDCNDHQSLRSDPGLKTAVGSLPETGQALASQPTLSRFENRVGNCELHRLSDALIDAYVAAHPAPRKIIVLDVDATDDPTHGQQQLSMFHGYYDQYMLHPLLIFDGLTGFPVAAVLRAGNAHASKGAAAILKRIIGRLKKAYPKVTILVRADAGFAVPAIYTLLEREKVKYTIGLITNERLRKRAANLVLKAEEEFAKAGKKQRLFGSFHHRADTWLRSRRVIAKVERLPRGLNTRFVVTNILFESADQIYDSIYTGRGDAENRIKELKLHLKADRLSCTRFKANQFRLLLHTFAFVLLWRLRQSLAGTELAVATVDTIKLKLLKIGARVVQSVRRVHFTMPRAYPYQRLFAIALQNIQKMPLRH
jgi:hypothetical protein